jgi:CelD/BcsL family acetyltransferase involved in cellulose biosynthesis
MSTQAMTTVTGDVLTRADDLRRLAPDWHALLADGDGNEPAVGPEWMLAWWEVFGGRDGRRLRCLRVEDGGELIGLVPLQSRRHWYAPGLPFRRLEMLASGEREADAICSDYLAPITRRGREAEVVRALAGALARRRLGGWDELVIPLMDGSGPIPEMLVREARGRGWHADAVETTRAPYIALPDTWDEFLRNLDKKDRYLVTRTLRDFEAWADGGAVFHRAADAAGLEEGKRHLLALHQERWEGAAGGTFRSPLFLAFHDRLMAALLARGALELIWLTVRGEAVAVMYDIRWGGKVSFYQCGRAMGVPKQIRPGGVLLYHAIREAIASGMREFDFLGGEATYKKQLTSTTRPLVTVRIARPGLLESGRRLAERAKDRLRPHWRRWRGKADAAGPK